jgi:hypothetical protein
MVLPDPVSATPTVSLPDRVDGHEAAWMGVGFVKLAKGDGFFSRRFVEGRWRNSMTGRRTLVDLGSVRVISLVERKASMSA